MTVYSLPISLCRKQFLCKRFKFLLANPSFHKLNNKWISWCQARGPVSTGQVAKKLGVSTQAVINWIEAEKIDAIKLPGGHYRIPADQFRTTAEQDAKRDAIFEQLWAKRKGVPPLDEDDLGDL